MRARGEGYPRHVARFPLGRRTRRLSPGVRHGDADPRTRGRRPVRRGRHPGETSVAILHLERGAGHRAAAEARGQDRIARRVRIPALDRARRRAGSPPHRRIARDGRRGEASGVQTRVRARSLHGSLRKKRRGAVRQTGRRLRHGEGLRASHRGTRGDGIPRSDTFRRHALLVPHVRRQGRGGVNGGPRGGECRRGFRHGGSRQAVFVERRRRGRHRGRQKLRPHAEPPGPTRRMDPKRERGQARAVQPGTRTGGWIDVSVEHQFRKR